MFPVSGHRTKQPVDTTQQSSSSVELKSKETVRISAIAATQVPVTSASASEQPGQAVGTQRPRPRPQTFPSLSVTAQSIEPVTVKPGQTSGVLPQNVPGMRQYSQLLLYRTGVGTKI